LFPPFTEFLFHLGVGGKIARIRLGKSLFDCLYFDKTAGLSAQPFRPSQDPTAGITGIIHVGAVCGPS
jgi:hypothetical protein